VGLAQVAQAAGFAFVMAGDAIVDGLGVQRTQRVNHLLENRMQIVVSTFLLSNLAQNLAFTGAFEIVVNGETVFSKIRTGRMPAVEEVLDKVGAAIGAVEPSASLGGVPGRSGAAGGGPVHAAAAAA